MAQILKCINNNGNIYVINVDNITLIRSDKDAMRIEFHFVDGSEYVCDYSDNGVNYDEIVKSILENL